MISNDFGGIKNKKCNLQLIYFFIKEYLSLCEKWINVVVYSLLFLNFLNPPLGFADTVELWENWKKEYTQNNFFPL